MATDNRDAFSRLVELHQQGLRRFLLNMTNGNYAVTDDIAQETFIKAWLAIRSFHGLSGFKTWLYRIAINEYATYRRQAARYDTVGLDAGELVIEDTATKVSTADARIDVAEVIKHLPEKERMVTLLFYLEELPLKDIVKVTGMPEGTVKSHLSRARGHLAKVYGK